MIDNGASQIQVASSIGTIVLARKSKHRPISKKYSIPEKSTDVEHDHELQVRRVWDIQRTSVYASIDERIVPPRSLLANL